VIIGDTGAIAGHRVERKPASTQEKHRDDVDEPEQVPKEGNQAGVTSVTSKETTQTSPNTVLRTPLLQYQLLQTPQPSAFSNMALSVVKEFITLLGRICQVVFGNRSKSREA
jgi:hypothetical protein